MTAAMAQTAAVGTVAVETGNQNFFDRPIYRIPMIFGG